MRLRYRPDMLYRFVLSSCVIGSLLLGGHGSASAQEPTPQWDDMPMASSGSDPRLERRMSQVSPDPGPSHHQEGSVGTIYVGVPIMNAVDRDVVHAGGSLDFRGGYDFGWVVPELEAGFMGLPVTSSVGSRQPLKQIYFGFGARLQIPNRTFVLPYVSAAFDFQFWNLYETATSCGFWYCYERDYYRFTPGFSGRTGVTMRITGKLALDLGLRIGMAFPGDVFGASKSWVQPSFGLTLWN